MKIILILFLLIKPLYALEIPENKRVDHWVQRFTGDKKEFFQRSLTRSGLYREKIKSVFKKEGIPEELSWLPLIESGFNCSADSKAKAAGCWQFIPMTGEAFGLKKDSWTDQRYDFNKSTIAAAKYLKQLNKQFKDWDLVLAAYNTGPTNVIKAIKKKGRNYWDLELYEETMNYVPQLYAVIKITQNLREYGFKEPKNNLTVVHLKEGIHNLKYIAGNILRVDYDVFKRLNPGYKLGYTPPNEVTKIYLMRDWDISLLRGFGFLAKSSQN